MVTEPVSSVSEACIPDFEDWKSTKCAVPPLAVDALVLHAISRKSKQISTITSITSAGESLALSLFCRKRLLRDIGLAADAIMKTRAGSHVNANLFADYLRSVSFQSLDEPTTNKAFTDQRGNWLRDNCPSNLRVEGA
jgi:hypothetical protein